MWGYSGLQKCGDQYTYCKTYAETFQFTYPAAPGVFFGNCFSLSFNCRLLHLVFRTQCGVADSQLFIFESGMHIGGFGLFEDRFNYFQGHGRISVGLYDFGLNLSLF